MRTYSYSFSLFSISDMVGLIASTDALEFRFSINERGVSVKMYLRSRCPINLEIH